MYDATFGIVTKDGSPQVVSQKATYTFTFEGRPCATTIHLRLANGQIQFDRTTFTCA